MERFNAEGYFSPTEYEALRRVRLSERNDDHRIMGGYRPLVYICTPYAGEVRQNTENAKKYSRFALENKTIPLTPYLLYPQFIDDGDPAEHRMHRKINYVLLGKCDELWVFGSVLSSDMAYEIIEVARKRRMKIRYFTAEMRESI